MTPRLNATAYAVIQVRLKNIYARSGTLQPDNAMPMWPRLHIWPQLRWEMLGMRGMLGCGRASCLRSDITRADSGPE